MSRTSWSCSSCSLLRSSAASWRSCMSRIARAWISSISRNSCSWTCAWAADGLCRIRAITWSMTSIALSKATTMCSRSRFCLSRYAVRREITSTW